tara:strand:+ start:287 stop:1093 length:807 start_codon:yes stop_codon:yes gene_type:complete
MAQLRHEPLTDLIGCIIHDIDLRRVTDNEVARIKAALRKHLVIFFRDQQLTPRNLFDLASKLGTPAPYPFVDGLAGLPEVVEIVKQPGDTVNFGGVWHSDTAYLEEPAMGALLYGVDIPREGGDTLFANMYAVLESLSPELRLLLKDLRAVNDADKAAISQTRPGAQRKGLKACHPVVRTHPETQRELLYINRAHTTHFENWTAEESTPLLDFLCQRIEQPEFGCRFKWEPGSLAFWDNRACQHFPINDYDGHLRRMLRISFAGKRPV